MPESSDVPGQKPTSSLVSEPLPPPSIQSFSERNQPSSTAPPATPPATTIASCKVARTGSTHVNNHPPFPQPQKSPPAPVSEEDAQKEATKLTEEISKVKGTVVVTNDAPLKASNIQASPGLLEKNTKPVILSEQPLHDNSQLNFKSAQSKPTGVQANSTNPNPSLLRPVSISPTPILSSSASPSPQLTAVEQRTKSSESLLSDSASNRSVSGSSAATPQSKQSAVHAHFLLKEVVGHAGVRSRSGSNSFPQGSAPMAGVAPASNTASQVSFSAPQGNGTNGSAAAAVGRAKSPTSSQSATGAGANSSILNPAHGINAPNTPSPQTLAETPAISVSTPTLNPVLSNSSVISTSPGGVKSQNIDRQLLSNDRVGSTISLVKPTSPPPLNSQQSQTQTPTIQPGQVKPQSQQPVANQTVPAGTGDISTDPRLPQDDGKLHILLAATGSISTGKLRMIILKLKEIYGPDRVSIQIILTKAAENFVSRGEIPSNVHIWRDQDEWATWRGRSDPVVHIELRRWADILAIAPLSANTLGKIALGLCDNLLTNVVRAWNTQYPILIAPAMVPYAYNNPATKRHLQVIKEEMGWIEVLKPVEKVVGSYGDIGMGGMMDWNEIVNRIVLKLGGYPEDDDDDDDDNDNDNDDGDDDDDDDEDDDDQTDDKEVTTSSEANRKENNTKDTLKATKEPETDAKKKKKVPSKQLEESEFDDDDLDIVIKKLTLADRDNLGVLKRQTMDL